MPPSQPVAYGSRYADGTPNRSLLPAGPYSATVGCLIDLDMSLAPPEARGPLRRERLRTARLYFVCEARPRGDDPEALLQAALTGGADIVQLREKELDRASDRAPAQTFRALLRHLQRALHRQRRSLPRPGLRRRRRARRPGRHARGRGARGPRHRGDHRALHPPRGADCRRRGAPVDYVSVGPDLGDADQRGPPGVGLELVAHAAAAATAPLLRDRRHRPSNARQVVDAGARRLGVVRSIRDAEDPAAAAAALRGALGADGRRHPVAEPARPSARRAADAHRRRASGWKRDYARAEERNRRGAGGTRATCRGRAAPGGDDRSGRLSPGRHLDRGRLPGRR